MSIKLPPPPRAPGTSIELQIWMETVWNFIYGTTGRIVTTGDVAATIGTGEVYHGVTALTAPRTLTLPSTLLLQDGDALIVQDESGSAGTQTITISRAGTDTINGATTVTITTNYGRRTLIKRGAGKWYSA